MSHTNSPAGSRLPRNVTLRLVPATLTLAALAAAQLGCGAGAQTGSDSTAATNPPPVEGTVTVDPKLFGFTLSPETAEAGPVTFVVTNNDFLPHDFRLTGEGVDEQTARLSPGDSDTLTVDLAPGAYTYYFTVEGHSENMKGTFTVE